MTTKTDKSQEELVYLIRWFFFKLAMFFMLVTVLAYIFMLIADQRREIKSINQTLCALAKIQIEKTQGIDLSKVKCLE